MAGNAAGDLSAVFAGIVEAWRGAAKPGAYADWLGTLRDRAAAAIATDTELLTSASDPSTRRGSTASCCPAWPTTRW